MRALLRRFKREVRARTDILPETTVVLSDDPARRVNTRAAELLLMETFSGRIQVARAPGGIRCGSRDEAASLRLAAYTEDRAVREEVLLSSLTAEEIRTYLKERTGEDCEVFVPDTPEVRFLADLSADFGDVKYGL